MKDVQHLESKEIECDVLIIGAGVSGLFLAKELKKCNISFRIIEQSPSEIGGFATWGDIKLGLLPAGMSTAKYLGIKKYNTYLSEFLSTNESILEIPKLKETNNLQKKDYDQKKYDSYILRKKEGDLLNNKLFQLTKEFFIFATVTSLVKKNESFRISLSNEQVVHCQKVVIASGRNQKMTEILKSSGENFHQNVTALIGCRVEFNPDEVEKLVLDQLDFKIKGEQKFQTYCFNHTGIVKSYNYLGKTVYCGVLDKNSSVGNAFFGKKVVINNDEIAQILKDETSTNYINFQNNSNLKSNNYLEGLDEFLKYFSNTFNIKLQKMFFPALEQFWPKPQLIHNTLESKTLKNLYYIGDVSGISYGYLQCYITSKFILEELNCD